MGHCSECKVLKEALKLVAENVGREVVESALMHAMEHA
jgi:hypothetical protein